jgi:hypothetical protein
VLGIDPWIFPDAGAKVTTFLFAITPMAYVFLAILLFVTGVRAQKFFLQLAQRKWPVLNLNDVFVGTVWASLILFSLTRMEPRTRYALHIVWCFPFLLSYAYATSPKLLRGVLGGISVILVGINIHTSSTLISHWRSPKFSRQHANMPDLKPLQKYFKKHGITHCYAGWWLAYRINVETQESIICSPPFNDRFREWPQPFYRELVDGESNTPYVVGLYAHRFLRGLALDKNLKRHGFRFDKKRVGAFAVYRNFRHYSGASSQLVHADSYSVISKATDEKIPLLADGDLTRNWISEKNQHTGMTVKIVLENPTKVHALTLISPDKVLESDAPGINLFFRSENAERIPIIENAVGTPHLLKLDKQEKRSYYPGLSLSFGFEPVETTELQIEIQTPQSSRRWRLSEIQLFAE